MRMLLDLLPAGVGDWPGSTPCKLIETQLVVRKSTASAPACGVSPIQEQT
jgi:hypothetical protein